MTKIEKNVLGTPLASCSRDPLTGFFRDGQCRTCEEDRGLHIVCARMTGEFLEYSKSRGNDLSTPKPELQFAGLKPGDAWCLCAARWVEALRAEVAPPILLEATHELVLEVVDLATLLRYAETNGLAI